MPDHDYKVATKGEGYAFVYMPNGGNVQLQLDQLGFLKGMATWYDPRNGLCNDSFAFEAKGDFTFSSPSNGRGNDWILILDDISKDYIHPDKIRF